MVPLSHEGPTNVPAVSRVRLADLEVERTNVGRHIATVQGSTLPHQRGSTGKKFSKRQDTVTSYSNYGRAQTFQKFALPGARASHNEHPLRPRLIQRLGEQHTLATRVVERTIYKIALADTRSYKVAAHLHILLQRIDTGVEEMRTSQPLKRIGLLPRTRRQIARHEQVLQVSHL